MTRSLYFDEVPLKQYYMVAEGQPETLFDPNAPRAIVATQGTVEEWTVQNRTPENHAFHSHQIHFLVESQDNFEDQRIPAGARHHRPVSGYGTSAVLGREL
jgi:FtsP/CotA-like multicopper oxidase with cupredoxin domain